MIDVIKDNELKDTLTNYIVYADFVGKKTIEDVQNVMMQQKCL